MKPLNLNQLLSKIESLIDHCKDLHNQINSLARSFESFQEQKNLERDQAESERQELAKYVKDLMQAAILNQDDKEAMAACLKAYMDAQDDLIRELSDPSDTKNQV